MTVKKLSLFSLYCLLISSHCFGESSDKPLFNISPTVCITQDEKNNCKFNIHIRFSLAPYTELCLEVVGRPQHSQCYHQLGLIEEYIYLQTTHSLTVQLVDPLTNQVVKQQQLDVAKYEAKDYRVKRRFGWSL